MDRVTALVAIAHLKLRLQRLQRNPHLLEVTDMIDIKRPVELAGMKARLARAKALEAGIAVTGKRYDAVLDAIDEQHKALQGHAGALEDQKSQLDQILGTMMAGSNGDPNDGETGSAGSGTQQPGAEVGQVITSTATGQ